MSSPLSLLSAPDVETVERFVLSAGAVLVFGAARLLADRAWVRRVGGADRHRRRVGLRLATNGALALVLLALWISQLQTVVLSLAAVMVAVVIATKELIMCAAGAVLRVGGHLFRVGDRIEVRGLHGEVIDHGVFSTTLLELPPAGAGHRGTGRTFVLPNSAFLTEAVRIEAGPRRYAPHRFALTLEHPVRAGEALAALRLVAEEACADDLERAARFHSMAASRTGCEDEGPSPRVRVATNEWGKLVFEVSVYCLVEEADALEAAIATQWLDRFAVPAERAVSDETHAGRTPVTMPTSALASASPRDDGRSGAVSAEEAGTAVADGALRELTATAQRMRTAA